MAGGKNSAKKEKKAAKGESSTFLVKAFGGAVVAIVVAAAIGSFLQWRATKRPEAEVKNLELLGTKLELQSKLQKMMEDMQKVEEARSAAEAEKSSVEQGQGGAGLGPGVMQAQAAMIGRLLSLVQQVDQLKGDDQKEERMAVSKRVEEEIVELEVSAKEHAGTAIGKQQAGLIALVREALKFDREGKDISEDEWNDDVLRQKHGLVTYSTPAYWDDAYIAGRYGETFDWYGAWTEDDLRGKSLGAVVKPLVKPSARILVLGCGNSNMSALMHSDGYTNIMNVDISEKVIEQMKDKHAQVQGLEWRAMDASKMDFPDGSFDAVVEKGMFDSLYAGTGERVQGVLSEVLRVLRPGAQLVSVSFAGDRIDRLFEAAQDGASAPPLGCRVAEEMSYRKTMNASEGEDESKSIYVYSCERKA
mmetsp:Transcript_86123/g.278223  ORF Transcript_86123/g.278223 Transcript_86123/m.278223 type:complete len:418 (-) Transcript_86123:108-1361(-)